MADNYLENHYEDYLKRKAAWEKSKGRKCVIPKQTPPAEPEDESL
jgi:hypothetical protein